MSGGDLCDAFELELADGRRAFAKTRADVPAGAFPAEAAGLRWLGEPGALAVPEVLAVDATMLVLEWVEPGGPLDEEVLGRGLAAVHGAGARAFGGDRPLFLGPLELPNGPCDSFAELYGEHRLRPLLGALDAPGQAAVERVIDRLDDLVPEEPPARLHGDLWSGNVLAGAGGRPWLIDPAAYGGHREVDLAMLALFGGPGPRFRAAYEEVAPLADGAADRAGLWQLFPLLVHAALFGGGYGSRAVAVARRYG